MSPEIISPLTRVERELLRIWEQELQRAPIGIQEDFFDLGGTSVQVARIFARIEGIFHKALPVSVIISAPTIEKLAEVLVPGKSGYRDRIAYVIPIQSEGGSPALYCIGGGTSWRPLSECLGPNQPVFNIGLKRGSLERMSGPNPMEKLARHMVSALCEKQPQGPYFLCGYCQDGLFAYEVARQLKMYGHEVGLLALIETQNPFPHFKIRVVCGLRRIAIRSAYQANQLGRLIRSGEVLQYARDRFTELKRFTLRMSASASHGFQVRMRKLGRVDSQQFLYFYSSFSRPKPLDCPTVIFRCADWPILSAGDPYFGWRELLKGRSETYEIPGDHEGLFREPSIRVLGEKLRACLQNERQLETPNYDVVEGLKQALATYGRRTESM